MKHRLATAINMAYDFALTRANEKGSITWAQLEDIVVDYESGINALMRGEKLTSETGQVMQLSGGNVYAIEYNDMVNRTAKIGEPEPQPDVFEG